MVVLGQPVHNVQVWTSCVYDVQHIYVFIVSIIYSNHWDSMATSLMTIATNSLWPVMMHTSPILAVMLELASPCSIQRAFVPYTCSIAQHLTGFCWQRPLSTVLHHLVLHHTYNSCHPLPVLIQFQGWHLIHNKLPYIHLSWLCSWLCNTDPYISCSMSSLPSMMSVFTGALIPLQSVVRAYLGNLIYPRMTAVPFFGVRWWHICKHLNFSCIWAHTLSWNCFINQDTYFC